MSSCAGPMALSGNTSMIDFYDIARTSLRNRGKSATEEQIRAVAEAGRIAYEEKNCEGSIVAMATVIRSFEKQGVI